MKYVSMAVIMLLGLGSSARAVIPNGVFLDRTTFETAAGESVTLDFEGIAPENSSIQPAPSFDDVLFEGRAFNEYLTGLMTIADANNAEWGSPGFSTPTDVMFVNALAGLNAQALFNEPVNAVGFLFNIGFDDVRPGRVKAYAGTDELASVDLTTSNAFDTFVGFANLGPIDRVEMISLGDRGDFVLFDDFTYSRPVPEPGTILLLVVAAAALLVQGRLGRR